MPDQNFQLPESTRGVLPQGLGEDFFSSLDQLLQVQEKQGMENLLGFQESRGLAQSGDTNKRMVQDVLGPGLARRQQALLPMAMRSAEIGQGQQFQTGFEQMQFKQQQEYQKQAFLNQMQMMQEQAALNEQLAYFQTQLGPSAPSFGTEIGQSFQHGLAKGVGGIGENLPGALLSGAGGFAGAAPGMGASGFGKGFMSGF